MRGSASKNSKRGEKFLSAEKDAGSETKDGWRRERGRVGYDFTPVGHAPRATSEDGRGTVSRAVSRWICRRGKDV